LTIYKALLSAWAFQNCYTCVLCIKISYPNNPFVHIEHLYSPSSRKLFRGAPNSSKAKRSSLKVSKSAGDKALGKIWSFRRGRSRSRAHQGESTTLLSGGTGKRNKEKTLLGWVESSRR